MPQKRVQSGLLSDDDVVDLPDGKDRIGLLQSLQQLELLAYNSPAMLTVAE
jgi:hypothetical protein